MSKKLIAISLLLSLLIPTSLFGHRNAQAVHIIKGSPELQRQVTVTRDIFGVPHVAASSDHDAYFMMGYLHARDRLFQMDVIRRQGSGTLAELLGAGPDDQILGGDTFFRTLGVGRSAIRSLGVYSPQAAALIQAYSDGVNAWLGSNPLPPEYTLLEITEIPRWRPIDTITIVKLFQLQLSFDTSDVNRTEALERYQAAGQAGGFDGVGLFFEDIFTVAPFENIQTVPRPGSAETRSSQYAQASNVQSRMIEEARQFNNMISSDVMEAARKFIAQSKHNQLLNSAKLGIGSNWWVIAGSKTNTGNAMLANDPHLDLGIPSTFYEIHLTVDAHSSPMDVYGVSFPGVPGVFLGQNGRISWGATTSALDVTDFFAESLVSENGVPIATRYKDEIEPLVIIPEEFKVNQVQNGVANDVVVISSGARPSGLDVPPVTLVAPRRNNGALFLGGPTGAISIQFTGASATRDLEGVFSLARANNLIDFKQALQLIEGGPLNWAYADVEGNIATFVNGKVPLREDLQAGTIDGLPPFFLRDGTGAARNEWTPKSDAGTGFNYESLPFDEMPQSVNPVQGFLVNANNDPTGITFDNDPINQLRHEGLYYISSGFNPGFRAAKITNLLTQRLDRLHGHGKVSFQDMQRIQNNVQMFDAEVFTPYIIQAFNLARSQGAPAELAAFAKDKAVKEAVGRLSEWDYSAPTGILEGYDVNDINGIRLQPLSSEVSNSIAATIYNVWRSQILANTIITTLKRVGLEGFQPGSDRLLVDLRFLFDNFSANQGVGASGLDFFEIPGVAAPPAVRRNVIILKSLKDALNLLAGDAFSDAFRGSTNQNDYRWGKLHRITFRHPFENLAPQFSIPTAGNFVDLSPTLPGLATDGSFETIDIAPFEPLAASSNAYTYGGGAVRRYVGELGCTGIRSVQIIPGGESGVVGNRFYTNQIPLWLTNDYHRVLFTDGEINRNLYSKVIYRPSN